MLLIQIIIIDRSVAKCCVYDWIYIRLERILSKLNSTLNSKNNNDLLERNNAKFKVCAKKTFILLEVRLENASEFFSRMSYNFNSLSTNVVQRGVEVAMMIYTQIIHTSYVQTPFVWFQCRHVLHVNIYWKEVI